ncbi:RHS repeat protein, partial [Piscirickettsia litoralis]|uniref:RHS repeat protein n=1 Tax=Piscirickettsia litoralis TaxID=1891921 RepID=UPI0013900700
VTTAVLLALGLNSAVASSQSINFLQQYKDSTAQSKIEPKHSKQTHAKQNNNTKESAKKKLAKEIKKTKDAPKTMSLVATPDVPSSPGDYNSKEFYRSMIQNAPVSKVDPFTGALIVHIPLVSIPGNDSLNLNVTWSYRSGEDVSPFEPNEGIFTGLVETNLIDAFCDYGSSSSPSCNDPNVVVFQDPSGGRHKLYTTSPSRGGAHGIGTRLFESMDGWRADLGVSYSGSGPYAGFGGWIYAPDGTTYHVFNSWPYTGESPVDQIVSPHGGEKITYAYSRSGGGVRDPFHLQTITMGNYKLIVSGSTITSSDGKTWQIDPRTINGKTGPQPDPAYIKLPDKSEWHLGWAGTQINSIIYPDGGQSQFQLASYSISDKQTAPRLATTYVTKQTNSGPGITKGTWSYDYEVTANTGRWGYKGNQAYTTGEAIPATLITKITSPGKEVDYQFLTAYDVGPTPSWQTGLLSNKTVYKIQDVIKTPLEVSAYTWSKRHIAKSFGYGFEIAQPQLATQTIKRVGVTYSTTYGYDDNSMVNYVSKSSLQGSRTEALSNYEKKYTINAVPHLLFIPQNEEWKDSGGKAVNQIARTFNDTGELLDQTENGVKTSYTYDAAGNIATITNALGHKTTLQNYVAGMPQLITDAAGNQFKFVINSNGTITSYTDGLGNKTSYEYDSMYRLTKLTPPIGDPVTLTWHNFTAPSGQATKTVTRGNFKSTSWFDGFGRTTSTAQYNNGKAINLVKIRYDAYGREMFRSYPEPFDYSPDNLAGFLGTYTTRDALGRVTAVEAPLPLTKIGDGLSPIPYQG